MWQTGTITPAQEHFISNLVRQKLIVAIDSIIESDNIESKTFLLYLPEKELHELSLLFTYYLLKKRGQKVFYLGAMLPVESLKAVEKLKPVDYLVTSIVGSMDDNEVNAYLRALSKEIPDKTIFVTGQQAESKNPPAENIRITPTINHFIDIIDKMFAHR